MAYNSVQPRLMRIKQILTPDDFVIYFFHPSYLSLATTNQYGLCGDHENLRLRQVLYVRVGKTRKNPLGRYKEERR